MKFHYLFLYSFEPEINEVLSYAAHFGRLSLVMYLLCFFSIKKLPTEKQIPRDYQKSPWIFAIMHVIHFIFWLSMYLNEVPIIPTRMTGFFAYLMIVVYPYYINGN